MFASFTMEMYLKMFLKIRVILIFFCFQTLIGSKSGITGSKSGIITKTRLFKYLEKFTSKNWKFSDIKLFFHISAENIDYGFPKQGNRKETTEPLSIQIKRKRELQSRFMNRGRETGHYRAVSQVEVERKGTELKNPFFKQIERGRA